MMRMSPGPLVPTHRPSRNRTIRWYSRTTFTALAMTNSTTTATIPATTAPVAASPIKPNPVI